jgi:transcriptional regulator with GAF, ATPase, and Fis domain
MNENARTSNDLHAALAPVEAAMRDGLPAREVFQRLHDAIAEVVGFKVLTVLKLDPDTLRSVRLYSSEPSYPIGGTKQHVRSAWSEAIIDRRTPYIAHNLAELRATFPDSAAIEATGCASILCAPIVVGSTVFGTMNLWHRDGYYDHAKGMLTMPFASVIAPVVRDGDPASMQQRG